MRKAFLTILLALLTILQGHAVLKEKDLPQTLQILRTELTNYHRELSVQIERNREQSEMVRNQLIDIMKSSNQNSLMLYSQKQDYVFDLTYACHEATEQYHNFQRKQLPFKTFLIKAETDIARYDSLIGALRSMPVTMLDRQGQIDRNVCLTLATNIRNSLDDNRAIMQDYIHYYDMTEQRLSHLNDYAQKRYNDIQTSIFRNGGESYFHIIAQWKKYWNTMVETVRKKYQPNNESQWDSRWIFGLLISIIFYGIIASALNFAGIRYVVPKRLRTEEFKKKRTCITLATTTITFAIILGLAMALTKQNFVIMASNLLVNYAWLLGVILISLLLSLIVSSRRDSKYLERMKAESTTLRIFIIDVKKNSVIYFNRSDLRNKKQTDLNSFYSHFHKAIHDIMCGGKDSAITFSCNGNSHSCLVLFLECRGKFVIYRIRFFAVV